MQGQKLTQQVRQQMRLNMRQMMLGRLLEMSAPEFEEEIVRAIEENPAISVVDSEVQAADSDDVSDMDGYDDDYSSLPAGVARSARSEVPFLNYSGNSSEAESVERQIDDLHLSDLEREICHYIIGNLDSSGYLTRSAADIAYDMEVTAGTAVDVRVVEKMIDVVKSLDPAGIGASDLRECLLLQLVRLERSPEVDLAINIIENHFKSFSSNRIDDLYSNLKADKELVKAALKLIKGLNPKPGAALFDHSDARTQQISPDFIIELDENDCLQVALAALVPELAVDASFKIDSSKHIGRQAEEFIKERREGAEDFIDVVHRRSSTLMNIMKAIIKLQPEFFSSFEMSDVRPMVIRDIVELTGYDKSVVSRATSTKYMLCPAGMIALRELFGEKTTEAASSASVGPRTVEAAIRKIVDDEDKNKPLDDEALVDALAKMGLAVARRTVAKYRNKLGIPVARMRKQHFK